MDQTQARALLAGERARLQRLLQAATGQPQAAEIGDEVGNEPAPEPSLGFHLEPHNQLDSPVSAPAR